MFIKHGMRPLMRPFNVCTPLLTKTDVPICKMGHSGAREYFLLMSFLTPWLPMGIEHHFGTLTLSYSYILHYILEYSVKEIVNS